MACRMLDDIPVFVVSCHVQQIDFADDPKTLITVEGDQQKINHMIYVMALAKAFNTPDSDEHVWKLVEFSSRSADSW